MSQAETKNTSKTLSRRSALALVGVSAIASSAAALKAAGSATPDPVFAALDAYRRSSPSIEHDVESIKRLAKAQLFIIQPMIDNSSSFHDEGERALALKQLAEEIEDKCVRIENAEEEPPGSEPGGFSI